MWVTPIMHYMTPALWVIFDSYDVTTTNDSEQKTPQTSQKTTLYPDIVNDSKTHVPGNRLEFISNMSKNKHFIHFLPTYLLKAGIKAQHAGIEGDADVVIIEERHWAVTGYENYYCNCRCFDFTAVSFNYVSQHFPADKNWNHFDVCGKRGCMQRIVYVLAICSCHVRIRYYICIARYGSNQVYKVTGFITEIAFRCTYIWWYSRIQAKYTTCRWKDYSIAISWWRETAHNLDELRYLTVISPKYVSVERMPPTSRDTYCHCLQVHY